MPTKHIFFLCGAHPDLSPGFVREAQKSSFPLRPSWENQIPHRYDSKLVRVQQEKESCSKESSEEKMFNINFGCTDALIRHMFILGALFHNTRLHFVQVKLWIMTSLLTNCKHRAVNT